MEKKKQINELAKDICKGGCCSLLDWDDCEPRDGTCPIAKRIAEHLYEVGYRKKIKEID